MATRVAAAQEGPDEAMRQALAAGSAKEPSAVSNAKEVLAASSTLKASAASDVDVIEKNQIGGEKQVLLMGSPMCQTILRCDHDDDAGCKQSERSQVQELREAMRETSAG